jgi:hypothetical protein
MHSLSQDSAASVWKAEKVSSYQSEWPSYRAIPGLTRVRLTRPVRHGQGQRGLERACAWLV